MNHSLLNERHSHANDYSTATESRIDRLESSSNNSVGYALVVLVLLVAAYFAYAYYGQSMSVPVVTNQSTTPVTPPAVPTVVPSVIPPVVPATPPATTP